MKLKYASPTSISFLEADREGATNPHQAKAVVIPFGLERSVSYGGGTANGPRAILDASQQLELYDDELGHEAYKAYHVAVAETGRIDEDIERALDQLASIVDDVLQAGKFPFVLGGEHSLTAGAVRPFAVRFPDLVVLQFDAHADLRDGYMGQHHSHAAAMRRVLDNRNVSLVSVGIRAISRAEADFARANADRIQIHWARDQGSWDIDAIARPLRGRPTYITFDVDALDSALMPATGTPVPGGLSYLKCLEILRRAAEVSTIVGSDLVEFSPIEGLHAYDYTAAALAYKMLNYALALRRGIE